MAQHVKRYKGCCMMCAAWIRGQRKMSRPSELRKLGGKRAIKHKGWKSDV